MNGCEKKLDSVRASSTLRSRDWRLSAEPLVTSLAARCRDDSEQAKFSRFWRRCGKPAENLINISGKAKWMEMR